MCGIDMVNGVRASLSPKCTRRRTTIHEQGDSEHISLYN